ncbi:phasin family protein [uncultured Methylobacterium sp.]|uniref:phasin family protein n=1 Tax=uncultured Methylobacterium sp. TaxID=157278 RepID=UPI0035C98F70
MGRGKSMMTKPFDKAAFDKVRDMGQGGMDMMLKSVGTLSKTAQTMGIEWADFAKQSISHGSSTMQALAKASTPQAAMEIQTAYLKGSYERLMAQAKVMTELYTGFATEIGKEIGKPIDGMMPGKLPVAA